MGSFWTGQRTAQLSTGGETTTKSNEIEKNENNFKETLKSKSSENENLNSENIGTLEELIIKKID